jgi:hypothetical protein
MGLAAVTAGCGTRNEGYVDFEKTAPSTLDQKPETPESDGSVTDPSGGDSSPTDVRPASVTDGPDTSGLNHAISRTRSAPAEVLDQPESGTHPAAALTNDVGVDNALSGQPSESSSAPIAASGTTSRSNAYSTVVPGINSTAAQIVSPQSGLIGPADNPLIENAATSEPRKIELLIPEKVFRKERRSSAVRVSYDDLDLLKVLNMEPVPANAADYFPDWLKGLDGKSIRIRGFMYPTFEATGLTAFTLARDNGICCFVRQPKIYDIISVKLASGVTSDYIEGRPFDVEGILHIEPLADENNLSRLYRIDDAKVLR